MPRLFLRRVHHPATRRFCNLKITLSSRPHGTHVCTVATFIISVFNPLYYYFSIIRVRKHAKTRRFLSTDLFTTFTLLTRLWAGCAIIFFNYPSRIVTRWSPAIGSDTTVRRVIGWGEKIPGEVVKMRLCWFF